MVERGARQRRHVARARVPVRVEPAAHRGSRRRRRAVRVAHAQSAHVARPARRDGRHSSACSPRCWCRRWPVSPRCRCCSCAVYSPHVRQRRGRRMVRDVAAAGARGQRLHADVRRAVGERQLVSARRERPRVGRALARRIAVRNPAVEPARARRRRGDRGQRACRHDAPCRDGRRRRVHERGRRHRRPAVVRHARRAEPAASGAPRGSPRWCRCPRWRAARWCS